MHPIEFKTRVNHADIPKSYSKIEFCSLVVRFRYNATKQQSVNRSVGWQPRSDDSVFVMWCQMMKLLCDSQLTLFMHITHLEKHKCDVKLSLVLCNYLSRANNQLQVGQISTAAIKIKTKKFNDAFSFKKLATLNSIQFLTQPRCVSVFFLLIFVSVVFIWHLTVNWVSSISVSFIRQCAMCSV